MKNKALLCLAVLILAGGSMLIVAVPTLSSAISNDRTLPAIDSLPPLAPNVPSCVYTGPLWERWTLNVPLPTARFGFALIAPNGLSSVYAVGGLQSWTDALTTNERFDACSNTWQALAPLPAPRGYVQAAEMNGRVYIVGGVDHIISGTFGVQSSVWVYDTKINYWSEAASLPQALGGVAVAVANNKLYAFGGFDGHGPGVGDVDAVYEYDPGNDRWTARPVMPGGARSLAGAAELNGEIYVVGGVAGSPSGVTRNEIYNPGARTWGTRHPIGDGFYGLSLFKAPDGFMYALGGTHDASSSWYASYRYDPAADTWSSIPNEPQINDGYNHGLSSGVYAAGRLFLVGGVGIGINNQLSNVNESMRILESLCESSIQASPPSVAPGGHITYTIELHGEVNPLPNVILLDPIPGGTTFEGFIGDPAGGYYNASADQIEWHGPLSASPAPITITFSVRVNNGGWTHGQFLTNTLTIHNGLNVIERSVDTWIDAFDLSTSGKLVNRQTAVMGDVITYTVRAQTTAPASGTATMIDPIPLNTAYVPGSLTSTLGTASYTGGKIVWQGALAPRTGVYANTSGDYQWGDSHGNGVVPGVKYDWIEIADTGARFQFTNPDNAGCYHTAFPFDFTYYTSVITKAAVSTNGTLYFFDSYTGVTYPMSPENSPLPGSNSYQGYSFGRFIAPFWDDLYLAPGRVYYQVFGVAPNRKVVFEWDNVTRHASPTQPGAPGSFEMIVFEGSSAIQFQYKDMDFGNPAYNNGASASIGLQQYAEGLQYSYNTPSISDRLAILILPPHHSFTYPANYADITFAVTPSKVLPDRTPITNTATITGSSGQVITRTVGTLYGVPDFSTSYKRARQSIVRPGDTVEYEIHAVNTGPVDGPLQLSDAMPAGLVYDQGGLTYPFGSGDDSNGVVTWTGVVPAKSEATIHFNAYVSSGTIDPQSIVNTAILTDVVSGAVYRRSAGFGVPKLADLFVAASGPGVLESAAPFTYTITFGNAGPFDTEMGPMVRVDLPAGVSFASASADAVYWPTMNAVAWYPTTLAAGTSRAVTITVTPVDAPPGAVLTTTASISNLAQDWDPTNNIFQWFTRVGSAPNLLNDTAKTIDPATAGQGDVVTYTIRLHNTGSTTATTTITDPIPAGASHQSGSSTVDGAPIELYDAAAQQIRWSGSIAPGDDVVVRFRALVDTNSIVTNLVTIDDGAGLIFNRSAATRPVLWRVFLPVILR